MKTEIDENRNRCNPQKDTRDGMGDVAVVPAPQRTLHELWNSTQYPHTPCNRHDISASLGGNLSVALQPMCLRADPRGEPAQRTSLRCAWIDMSTPKPVSRLTAEVPP